MLGEPAHCADRDIGVNGIPRCAELAGAAKSTLSCCENGLEAVHEGLISNFFFLTGSFYR